MKFPIMELTMTITDILMTLMDGTPILMTTIQALIATHLLGLTELIVLELLELIQITI